MKILLWIKKNKVKHMRTKFIISLLFMVVANLIYGQIKSVGFGVQFEDEIELTGNKYSFINKVVIEELKNDYYKDYYFTMQTNDNNWINERNVIITSVVEKKYKLIIPPLKPNAFYRIKYEYYDENNLFAVMKMLHDEGIDKWDTEDKSWMKTFKLISEKFDPYILTYRTTKIDIIGFKEIIKNINLDADVSDETKGKIVKLTSAYFKNLTLNKIEISPNEALEYAKFINQVNVANITDTDLDKFEEILASCYDYVGFYDLYQKYFKSYFNNYPFITTNYINFFKDKIEEEKKSYTDDALPNLLINIDEQIQKGYKSLSTFATSFQTAFQRTIVPDFGYVIYINDENSFTGGSPFVGVNISLAPVNKDIPMQISTLTIWQRLSIHTGIVINSLSESKKRENLFKENSAMLGFGYKIFNHNFRINIGGVFYKSLDPITASKSFAVQPYVGLSIDFEIRKWLSQLVPALKL